MFGVLLPTGTGGEAPTVADDAPTVVGWFA